MQDNLLKMNKGNLMLQIFCTIGIIIQISFITDYYLEYHVTSEVTASVEDVFEPPALSACFPIPNLLREGYKCPKLSNNSFDDHVCLGEFNKNYTLSEMMENVTSDLLEMVTQIQITTPDYSWKRVPEAKISQNLDIFYRENKKCFRMRNSVKPFDMMLDMVSDMMTLSKYVYYVEGRGIKRGFHYHALFIHDADIFPRGYDHQMYVTHTMGRMNFYYRKTRTEYLPPPYPFKCVDYKERGIETKQHCIQNCLEQRMDDHQPNVTDERLTYTSFQKVGSKNLGFLHQLNLWNRECQKECPIGCVVQEYEPFPYNIEQSDNGTFLFTLYIGFPVLKVIFSPKKTMIEYLGDVASITSLWIGFVILDSLFLLGKAGWKLWMRFKASPQVHIAVSHQIIQSIQIHSNKHISITNDQMPPVQN